LLFAKKGLSFKVETALLLSSKPALCCIYWERLLSAWGLGEYMKLYLCCYCSHKTCVKSNPVCLGLKGDGGSLATVDERLAVEVRSLVGFLIIFLILLSSNMFSRSILAYLSSTSYCFLLIPTAFKVCYGDPPPLPEA
jgi:hypothetical protein